MGRSARRHAMYAIADGKSLIGRCLRRASRTGAQDGVVFECIVGSAGERGGRPAVSFHRGDDRDHDDVGRPARCAPLAVTLRDPTGASTTEATPTFDEVARAPGNESRRTGRGGRLGRR